MSDCKEGEENGMRRFMQSTSLEAYFETVLPKINQMHKDILQVFYENPLMDFTNTELSIEVELPINIITPRVYELRGRDKRFKFTHPPLIASGKRLCKITGKKAIAWQLNHEITMGGYKIS